MTKEAVTLTFEFRAAVGEAAPDYARLSTAADRLIALARDADAR